MKINFDAFLDTLPILAKGMLGIFVVTGIIVSCIWLLNKGTNSKRILLLSASVLLGVLLTISFVFSNQPEDAIDNFITAAEAPSAANVEKLYPADILESMVSENLNQAKIKEDILSYAVEQQTLYASKYGHDYRIDYTVLSKSKIVDADYDALVDGLVEKYKIDKNDINSLYVYELKVDIVGNFAEDTQNATIYCLDYNGTWYMLVESYEGLDFTVFVK